MRLKGTYRGCPGDQRHVRIPNKFLSENCFKQDLGNIWETKMHLEGNMATKVVAALTVSSQFLKEKVHLKELQLAEKEKNIRRALVSLQKIQEKYPYCAWRSEQFGKSKITGT